MQDRDIPEKWTSAAIKQVTLAFLQELKGCEQDLHDF